MDNHTLLLWASGSPACWQASQAGLFKSSSGWKSHFFWPPQGFVLHGPEIPWGPENQERPKKSSKGNAVESTARCILLLKKIKVKKLEAGLLPPSRVLPGPLALAAPLVGWMCPPAVCSAAHWALRGSTQRTSAALCPRPQDMWPSSNLSTTSTCLDGNFQALEMLSPLIFTFWAAALTSAT